METVLLSTHNIWLGSETIKLISDYALLSGGFPGLAFQNKMTPISLKQNSSVKYILFVVWFIGEFFFLNYMCVYSFIN